MVVNAKTINRLKAPLQIHEKTIGVTKLRCSVILKQTSLGLVTLRKPNRKRNNASAMIHNKRPKETGGR